jgi:hypothetical protein
VAYDGSFFYAVGSHGCPRHQAKFHASSFITARFRLDENGALLKPDGTRLALGADPKEAVQTTFRARDVDYPLGYSELTWKASRPNAL